MRIKKYLEYLERPLVVVHLKRGASIRGFLIEVYEDVLVLRDATHLSENNRIALEGDQLIPRENVDFLQHLRGDDE